MKRKRIFVLVISLLFPWPLFSKEANPIEWQYSEPDMELHNPSFSPDGKEIVFMKMVHVPDGGEAEGMDDKTFKDVMDHLEKIPHFGEPRIIKMDLKTKQATVVGNGWNPVFSPEGKFMAFSKQKQSLAGMRVLAETLAGNSMELFDLKSGNSKDAAIPSAGFFGQPFFSDDGKRLFYFAFDAVNGAWEGMVGINDYDMTNGKNETLIAPKKEFGLFDRIGDYQYFNGKLWAVVVRPAEKGMYLADSNFYDLLEIYPTPPKIIYSWGKRGEDDQDFEADFQVRQDGSVWVLNNGWTNIDPSTGKAINKPGRKDEAIGTISPNGRKIIGQKDRESHELFIGPAGKPWAKKLFTGKEYDIIREYNWSRDSKKVALIITSEEKGCDVLYILNAELNH
jgi:hypothetical protein